MNIHRTTAAGIAARPMLQLADYLREFCGERTEPGYAIGRACHELAAGGQLFGRYSCSVRRSDFQALAAFVDFVRREESIPLARERIGTDEQSALEAYPHVLEPVQE